MGGTGSGNWYRWQKKTTVEECHALDVNRWSREGLFAPGVERSGSWIWYRERDGERENLSTVGYRVRTEEDRTGWARLQYRNCRTGEEVDLRIRLETTRPHLGGLRWWF